MFINGESPCEVCEFFEDNECTIDRLCINYSEFVARSNKQNTKPSSAYICGEIARCRMVLHGVERYCKNRTGDPTYDAFDVTDIDVIKRLTQDHIKELEKELC